jgi:hypothetical protein
VCSQPHNGGPDKTVAKMNVTSALGWILGSQVFFHFFEAILTNFIQTPNGAIDVIAIRKVSQCGCLRC